jgi:putative NADH-flavin reductase
MNLALFGATQGIGREVTRQALQQGHTVTALVRSPEKLAEFASPQLTLIQGDVLTPADVDKTIPGASAVIIALGKTSNNPDNIVSKGTSLILQSMKNHGVSRLLVVTSLGVGDSRDQVPFFFKMLMKTVLKSTIADKEIQEEYVRTSGLDWTIVRPGGLTDGSLSGGKYRVSTGKELIASQVSRADVAEFLLEQLANPTYRQQAVGIS